MKTILGYMLILFLMPIFGWIVFLTTAETGQLKNIHTVLDEKIETERLTLNQTSFIKDQNGKVASEITGPENRILLSIDEIPVFMKDLFIVSEDRHFYNHPGFDLISIGRAFSTNIQNNEINQGASTITQQLVRNLYLSQEKTYNRKMSEILYAYQFERKMSKNQILQLYLNTIYFQNGAYGIEAASQLYFQRKVMELSRGEMAFLAAIPNNPTLYDPFRNFDLAKKRQERLLDQLNASGYLDTKEATNIKREPIHLNPKSRIDLFPDYTMYVQSELKQLISHSEGYEQRISETPALRDRQKINALLEQRVVDVLSSGIVIHTALNPKIQEKAAASLKKYLPYEDVQGASVVIDHKKHSILSLTGGKSYEKGTFNRGFQAFRQPGSAIKPLLVYAPYIEQTDAPLFKKIDASPFCKNGFCPENYGHSKYGSVTLENAFIHSYNTPAVRILNEIGVRRGFAYLNKFKFEQVTSQDYVLSSAIGGFTTGISPLELTAAYTSFANDGAYQPARAINKVTDKDGRILYRWNETATKIWSEKTTAKIRELLRQTVLHGTARKAAIPLPYAGGKTGTTNDYKDFWFVGLTDTVTAGVWVGKDRPENMKIIESKTPHLLIWKDIVNK